jgi:hypothetical protein
MQGQLSVGVLIGDSHVPGSPFPLTILHGPHDRELRTSISLDGYAPWLPLPLVGILSTHIVCELKRGPAADPGARRRRGCEARSSRRRTRCRAPSVPSCTRTCMDMSRCTRGLSPVPTPVHPHRARELWSAHAPRALSDSSHDKSAELNARKRLWLCALTALLESLRS